MKKQYVSPELSVFPVEDVIRTSSGDTSNLPPEVETDQVGGFGGVFPIG